MIIVVGAGIVGAVTALELQLRGIETLLIDKDEPGHGTSFGNAGVLSDSSIIVANNPKILSQLSKMILRQDPSIRVDIGFILSNLPWFIQFLKFCNEEHMIKSGRALRELQTISVPIHKRLLKKAGAQDILRNNGWMKLYRTEQGFDGAQAERNFLGKMGVLHSIFKQDNLGQMEPHLNSIYYGGMLIEETSSVSSPLKLTQTYVELFKSLGGKTRKSEVVDFSMDSTGVWNVFLNDEKNLKTDELVITTGPWTPEVLKKLSYKLPMAWERGYHTHVNAADHGQINRPIFDVESGFVISPMNEQLRILTGVEITHRDAPPNYSQMKKVIKSAREAYSFTDAATSKPWLGCRPTLPDSLPMVGPAPRHKGLWFNFGHQHIGLSTSTGCGHLLAEQIEGKPISKTFEAFLPERLKL